MSWWAALLETGDMNGDLSREEFALLWRQFRIQRRPAGARKPAVRQRPDTPTPPS